jgi:N-methylhydantoinase A
MNQGLGMLWIGIDVGGTFTDGVVYDTDAGTFRFAKVPSTPTDPTDAVLDLLGAMQVEISRIDRFVHGVTIGTNAVLTGRGGEVWMLVTKGFRDVLEIARTNRPILYDIRSQKTPPLVPRTRAIEIDERLMFDGSVLRPMEAAHIEAALAQVPQRADVALTICFLHSYINPAHEETAKAIVRRNRPDLYVSTSSEVLPQFREYERFNTTALNAYIGPLMGRYLSGLRSRLRQRGLTRDVYIMTSNGGVATAERAVDLPLATVLSGPAGGVAAAVHIGARVGISNLITCDMGGTSTDACLIEDLAIPITNEQQISGYANRMPQIAINAVGAGGGSIGWLDAGDILMVGPQSAGADPGPACYGRGGTEPTVTDANLALNRLSADSPLAGGQIRLDRDLALAALERLGKRIGLDAIRLADGIVRIAVARMVSAIKQISIANGHDPRDFVLLPFGGAGPMHAVAIAEELEIARVLVPVGPGNFAAFGALISDLRRDYARTRTLLLEPQSWDGVDRQFGEMEAAARANLLAEGVAAADIELRRSAGMRYLGQSWELHVDLPTDVATIEQLQQAFADVHDRRFGHRSGGAVEIVNFRIAAIGRVAKPELPQVAASGTRADPRIGTRDVHLGDTFLPTPVLLRERLVAGDTIAAPAVIEESGSLTLVPPGWTATVLPHGELLLTRG